MIPQMEGIQRCITDDPESFKDEYTIRTLNSNEMKNAEIYALTEIDIGYDFIRYTNYPISSNIEQQIKVYWLSIYREDVNLIMVPMLPGNVKLEEVEGEKNVYDLFVGFCHVKFTYDKFDIVLRIRCIKNTTIKGMISKEEEERYTKFAEKIEAHSEGRENAFKRLSLSLPHETAASALRTKMSDFKTLIELLCDPQTGNVEHVPSGKRYNQRSKCILSDRKYWIHKKQEKPRKETIKNEAKQFRDCKKIDLNSVKLADLDLQTLQSDNLERLWLNDIDLTEDIDTLKIYTKNITFSKLKDIDLNSCKTQILTDEIAKMLPVSLENILLQNCNITSIPKFISHLTNLEQLHLEENDGLIENGIPWDFLPPNLTSLSLEDKSITEVPASINRLKHLTVLNIVSDNLKTVEWEEISDTIEWLRIESKAELNPIKLSGKTSITYLLISCPFLTEFKSFPLTTHLYLDNCGLKTFSCQNSLQTLVELSIVENGLTSITWEYLPVTLENLNLSNNNLLKVENIGHLINLQELRLDDNDISFISTDIIQLQNLKLLYLSENYLTELPEGFENLLHLSDLRLADNDFEYDEKFPDELNKKLWKRLPLCLGQLVLNSNNLFKIPCCFRFIRFINLHITGCNLHHICPRIYLQAERLKTFSKSYCLSMDIRKNDTLKHLSFVPSIIYQPPSATEEKQNFDIINTFWMTSMEIATNNTNFRNTKKFPVNNFKPKYDFKPSEIKNFCDCCGVCGKATKAEALQKQNMVMDFMIIFTDKEDFDPFNKPKYEPGKWKSEIHTKICSSCRKAFIEKTDVAYENLKEENGEKTEKRQKLPNENTSSFVLGPEPLQIQEMQCLKLQNLNAVDCFLIAAVNAIDAMEEFKESICKNSNPLKKTQFELVKILNHKVKNVRVLRETLPSFATNEQEDAASALYKLIELMDVESQSLIMYSYDTVETCFCGPQKFRHAQNCITLHLTVGQYPNETISLNSMISNWTKFSSYCATCYTEKITEHTVQLGNLQKYFIIELNSLVNGPNGSLVQCSIPFTNFNINSHLMFGTLWELIGAIQYIGSGKAGHYVTWKKSKNGWIVINDENIKNETHLLPDLKEYRVLIFKKLIIQLISNNDVIMETNNGANFFNQQNQEAYIPNYLQNQVQNDTVTTYETPQNILPPISRFGNLPDQNSYPQYFSTNEIQPQQFQPMQTTITANISDRMNEHVVTDHSYQLIPDAFHNNSQTLNQNIPLYQAPQQFHQYIHQPLSPISSLINSAVNQQGDYISSADTAYTSTNINGFIEQQSEPEYMYYPEDDDEWAWKEHI